jgi:hypothetical protein
MIIGEDEQDVKVELQEKNCDCNEPKVYRGNCVVL